MRPNKIKQMWRDGKSATLGWLSVSHGFTAEIMARQGFDALCIDMQHGTSEMNDVLPLLQAISQTETVPIVRVAWNDPAVAGEKPYVIQVMPPAPPVTVPPDAIIIPYDPAEGEVPGDAEKLFLPYKRYQKLWTQAHPDKDPSTAAPARFALAGASLIYPSY